MTKEEVIQKAFLDYFTKTGKSGWYCARHAVRALQIWEQAVARDKETGGQYFDGLIEHDEPE